MQLKIHVFTQFLTLFSFFSLSLFISLFLRFVSFHCVVSLKDCDGPCCECVSVNPIYVHAIVLLWINTFLSATEILTYVLLTPELLFGWTLIARCGKRLASSDMCEYKCKQARVIWLYTSFAPAERCWTDQLFIFSIRSFLIHLFVPALFSYGKMFYDRNFCGSIENKRRIVLKLLAADCLKNLWNGSDGNN